MHIHLVPLFKTFQILKVSDILKVQQLKFHYGLKRIKLSVHCICFNFSRNYHFYDYLDYLFVFMLNKVNNTFATKCFRLD